MKIFAIKLNWFPVRSNIYYLISIIFMSLSSCTDQSVDEQMSYTYVNLQLSLLDPNYAIPLDKGFRYLSNVGTKGILLYRESSTSYIAFERCCSFKPQSQACQIVVDSSLLFIKDKCCGSFFKFDGTPYSGPAYRPLQQYSTIISGNTLYINN